MMCERCGKRPATVHYTEIENGQITELHLCEECAKQQGGGQPFSWADLLAGLAESSFVGRVEDEDKLVCEACGMRYVDFKKRGRLGCSHCYEAFKDSLMPLLRRIHGGTTHVGKHPAKGSPERQKLKERLRQLRAKLQAAVEAEEFEEAARLRDTIRELEGKLREKAKEQEAEKKDELG